MARDHRMAMLVALCCSTVPPGAALAADAAAAITECSTTNEASWPACSAGTLCWCANADVVYRRDKIILNDLVIYQGGSPLRVRAQHAETASTDTSDSIWILSGGVHARLAQGELQSDTATVHFEAGNLSSASFGGQPATFEESGAAGAGPAAAAGGAAGPVPGPVRGSANTIDYDARAGGEVQLRGAVRLFDGCKEILGEGFAYNLAQKGLRSLEPAAGARGERVRGSFQQKCRPAAPRSP